MNAEVPIDTAPLAKVRFRPSAAIRYTAPVAIVNSTYRFGTIPGSTAMIATAATISSG